MDNAEFARNEELFARWAALPLEDRNAVRRISALNNKFNMIFGGIEISVILLFILVPMAAVVLSNQSEVDRYTKRCAMCQRRRSLFTAQRSNRSADAQKQLICWATVQSCCGSRVIHRRWSRGSSTMC